MRRASSTFIGGLRRQGQFSSVSSQMLTPPWKCRPTQKVFGPDCSSMSLTPLLKPLMSAPITITTITPIATPRIVSAARTLLARSESSAMPTPSSSGVRGYSWRRATMGSSRAARLAGYTPATMPTPAPSSTPSAIETGHAEHGADRGERGRLGEELPQDVATAGAERLADADLTGALRHRHQHDVHDHDAAHHEGDEHEPRTDGQQDAVDLAPEVEHALRGLEDEVVVLVRAQVPAAPHDALHLPHRLAHLDLGARLHHQRVDHPRGVHLPLDGGDCGRDHELVERNAEQVAAPLGHADDAVGDAVDAD